MKSNEAISVSKDSLGLILSNVKNKIAQKQLIQKKLTPFLFHHVTAKSLMKNFDGMVKEEQKNSLMNQNNDQEPNKIQKDNFNPKDIKISNKKDFLQKYSLIQRKNGKTPRKRFYSALQTTRQKMKDKDFIEKRPSTSVTKNSNQEQPKLYSHQKSTNTNTNIQSNKKQFQKVLSNQQFTFRSISSRRLRRKQNYFVKLKEKDSQIQVNPYQSIQQKLRQQKIKKQIEKQILMQQQALKGQRIIKLKEKFHQKFKNSTNINFDFDGNLIDLKNQQQQPSFKNNLQKNGQKFANSMKTYFLQSNKKDVQPQSSKIQKNEEPIFVIQTSFKIKQSLRVLEKQTNSSKKSSHSFDKSTINIFQSPQTSYRNSLIKNLNTERKVRKPEKNYQPIFRNDNQEQSKTSKNYSLLRSSIKNSSFFSSKKQQNEKDEIQQNSSTEYVLNQKDFNNDNRRQISTIPYLEIEQGICYKQQMGLKPQKDESLVQYATISKQMSLKEKDSNKTFTGNRTFRSYLSFKKCQEKPIETFNRTFHTLNDKNKSVQSARIMTNIKTLNQHSSNIRNSIKIHSARNPLIEDLQDFLEEANIQPVIKNNFFQNQSNKYPFQNNDNLKKIKINTTQNILDLKSKLIMKQKIQRNLFQTQ